MINTQGKRLVDGQGRHVILNGVNLVCKDRSAGYLGGYDVALIQKLSSWGFNLVRLGIIWDGVEPEPFRYDDAYLGEIRRYMDLCHQYGIRVFLDMHQDLYGCRFSDGAPEWATLTGGKEHTTGEIWSDAYLLSAAVQTAFDHFWANAPTPGGCGLQDHFAKAWAHVLGVLGDHPALIGVDLFNEPFPGSPGVDLYGAVFASFARVLGEKTGRAMSPEEAAGLFASAEAMMEALTMVSDEPSFRRVMEPLAPLLTPFDRDVLGRFYVKMTNAVRDAGYSGIVLLENSYFSNAGIPAKIEPVTRNGARDPAQAYAPHGYDLVVDTPAVGALASDGRVQVIFGGHRAAQDRLGLPVIVGEWGAFAHYEDALPQCEYLIRLFERNLWSNTYWAYHDHFETEPALRLLRRGYPTATVGELLSYCYDFDTGRLAMAWDEGDTRRGVTEAYLPHAADLAGLDGAAAEPLPGGACLVRIPARGGRRTATIG